MKHLTPFAQEWYDLYHMRLNMASAHIKNSNGQHNGVAQYVLDSIRRDYGDERTWNERTDRLRRFLSTDRVVQLRSDGEWPK